MDRNNCNIGCSAKKRFLVLTLVLCTIVSSMLMTNVYAALTPQSPYLSATAGDKKVILSWSESYGANYYEVYRSSTSSGPYVSIMNSIKTLGYTDTTVSNENRYYYMVIAWNYYGKSEPSNTVSAVPKAYEVPTNLSATVSQSGVSLNWSASVGAILYYVNKSLYSRGPYSRIATISSGTSYVDTSGTNGYKYYYVVTASNGTGESTPSNEVSVTLRCSAPRNLTATAGPNTATLSWSSSTGATSYKVKKSTSLGGPYATISTITSGTKFIDTSVIGGTTYFYVVTALNAGGESPSSNEASVIPTLIAPTNLTALAGNEKVTLSWDVTPGAEWYKIYRAISGSSSGEVLIADNITETTFTDTDVYNFNKYVYIVYALNSYGSSSYATASATPKPPVPPIPTNLTAVAQDCKVILNWDAMPYTDYYEVLRSTTFDGPYEVLDNGTVATCIDRTAVAGTTYYYAVRGVSYCTGASSNKVSVVALPPLPPSNIRAASGDGWVELTWDPSPSASDITYTIFESRQPGGPYEVKVKDWEATSLSIRGKTNDTTYYYIITAENPCGTSEPTAEVAISTPHFAPPTGLTATAGDGTVTLHWNISSPSGVYNVKYSRTQGGPYSLYTVVTTDNQVVSGLTNGVTYYFIVTVDDCSGEKSSEEVAATPGI